jgi:tRNA threonylcarbamoyl adenosine modification protein YeaZ
MTGKPLLALETSTREGSVAVWSDGGIVFEESFSSERGHNSLLFAPLGRALEALDGKPPELVLAGTGPGSYAGTRVGIAAAQGVAIARECGVTGLPSLLATPEARSGRDSLAVGDARRGAWWTAKAAADGRIEGPEICDAEALFAQVGEAVSAGRPVVAFDPVPRLGLPGELAERVVPARPTARLLVEAWLALPEPERQSHVSRPPEPCYLRPPHVTEAKKGHPLFRKRNS